MSIRAWTSSRSPSRHAHSDICSSTSACPGPAWVCVCSSQEADRARLLEPSLQHVQLHAQRELHHRAARGRLRRAPPVLRQQWLGAGEVAALEAHARDDHVDRIRELGVVAGAVDRIARILDEPGLAIGIAGLRGRVGLGLEQRDPRGRLEPVVVELRGALGGAREVAACIAVVAEHLRRRADRLVDLRHQRFPAERLRLALEIGGLVDELLRIAQPQLGDDRGEATILSRCLRSCGNSGGATGESLAHASTRGSTPDRSSRSNASGISVSASRVNAATSSRSPSKQPSRANVAGDGGAAHAVA